MAHIGSATAHQTTQTLPPPPGRGSKPKSNKANHHPDLINIGDLTLGQDPHME